MPPLTPKLKFQLNFKSEINFSLLRIEQDPLLILAKNS